MKIWDSHILHRLLKIRPEEAQPFFHLSSHAFFNGFGVALAFTTVNTIVLDRQAVEILPWIYLGAYFLLVLASIGYNKLEHAFPPKRVFAYSLILCIVLAFVMGFLLNPENPLRYIGLAYCAYYLIYLLTNLDLWGSAALVFNVRQSKRLFGPLSSAESLGYIIGYSITPLFISMISEQNVLIISGMSFLVSLVVLYFMKNQYLHVQHEAAGTRHAHHETAHHHDNQSFWSRLFHNNNYIKHLSLLILLSTLVYYTLSYGFLSRVQVHFTDKVEIATFIGFFLGGAKFLNLLFKLIGTSRVYTKYGVPMGLYFLPTTIIVICLAGLCVVITGYKDSLFYIYLFSLLYFLDKLFRSSLSKPSFLILFQPLTPTLRLAGHTITKGYFEPLGMGLAGLIIILSQYLGWFSLRALVFYILIFSICWALACYLGIRQYLAELQKALHSRLFGSTSFQLSKNEVDLIVETKLNSPQHIDRLYALSLLADQIPKEQESDQYSILLSGDNPNIVVSSLEAIEKRKIPVAQDVILPLLHSEESPIREQAAYTLSALYDEESIDVLTAMIEENPEKNTSFIGALIKYTGLRGTLAVGHKLIQLTKSPDASDRVLAADIIDKTDNPEFDTILKDLVNDNNNEVAAAAIGACGSTTGIDLIETVINKTKQRHLLLPIKRCVSASPEKSEEVILNVYPDADRQKKRRLIELCTKIESSTNIDFLVSLLGDNDPTLSTEATDSLYTLGYSVDNSKNAQVVKDVISTKLKSLTNLVFYYSNTVEEPMLNSGIRNEIREIYIVQILRLMSFLFDREAIDKIIKNMSMEDETTVANAIELLENMMPNKWSHQFVPVIEKMNRTQIEGTGSAIDTVSDLMNSVVDESLLLSDYLIGLIIRTTSNLGISPIPAFVSAVSHRGSNIISEELDRLNQ